MKVHTFSMSEDTGDAYDDSQCRDDIKMGDILVVPKERVVGFLLSAWPIAVTKRHGNFHYKATTWEAVASPNAQDPRDWMPSVRRALEVAKELGYPVEE